jgi:hypothetical protein
MPPKSMQEKFIARWLEKQKSPHAARSRALAPGGKQKANPKWSDDNWFEKRYGDPGYYKKVKGLE